MAKRDRIAWGEFFPEDQEDPPQAAAERAADPASLIGTPLAFSMNASGLELYARLAEEVRAALRGGVAGLNAELASGADGFIGVDEVLDLAGAETVTLDQVLDLAAADVYADLPRPLTWDEVREAARRDDQVAREARVAQRVRDRALERQQHTVAQSRTTAVTSTIAADVADPCPNCGRMMVPRGLMRSWCGGCRQEWGMAESAVARARRV